MTSDSAALLSPYRGRSLLLDANLLLVLAIGHSDPLLIGRHKKTKGAYVPDDFDLLFDIIGAFAPCLTTPHILTEVSNQLGQGEGPIRHALFQSFAGIVPLLREYHAPCQVLVGYDQFPVYGLTDMGIVDLSMKQRSLVITADSALVAYLGRAEVDVIDYRWIKKAEDRW